VLRAAVAAYLGRYRGQTRLHINSDLPIFLRWCDEQDLEPLAAVRTDIERYVRWLQEVRRFQPSTVSRRLSIVVGFYRVCLIDGLLPHSPAAYVRRPPVPAESPTLGLGHLQFEALITTARESTNLADEATRTAMGVDAEHEFKTKPQLGADLLSDAVDAGVRVDWCTGDAVYGRDRGLRAACEKRGIGYSLGVPCSFRIKLGSGTVLRADATPKILARDARQVASCGPGSKGERHYAWAWIGTASPRHFLLIRRSLNRPNDLAYFYCYMPEQIPATLGVLATVTGRRWTIEEDHEFGKDQFGFDQSQVRLYTPIMRHVVLVMAAFRS
jgi:hypothetical protein